MRFRIPIASLMLACTTLPLAAQQTVRESESGVEFPVALIGPTGDSLILMGTGIRTRTILKVKVYAFGLYVDPEDAKTHLVQFAGIPHYELEEQQAFYDALLGMNFPMALRLVMTRDVGADDMASAFDDALRPRVEQAAAEMEMPGGLGALDRFRGFFDVGEMTSGSELVFVCEPDGSLHARIKGNPASTLENRALCWALFDVYLGRNPISQSGKKGVILGFPNLLIQRRGAG